MDYLHPAMFDFVPMLIPMPNVTSLNISAVWKPFQPYVGLNVTHIIFFNTFYPQQNVFLKIWLCLFLFTILAALSLSILKRRDKNGGFESNQAYGMFVISLLLSQCINVILLFHRKVCRNNMLNFIYSRQLFHSKIEIPFCRRCMVPRGIRLSDRI